MRLLHIIYLVIFCTLLGCKNEKHAVGTLEVIDYKPIDEYHFAFNKNITVAEVVQQLKKKANVNIVDAVGNNPKKVNFSSNLTTMQVMVEMAKQLKTNFVDCFAVSPSTYSWRIYGDYYKIKNYLDDSLYFSLMIDTRRRDLIDLLVLTDWRQFKITKIKNIVIKQNNEQISLNYGQQYFPKEGFNMFWNIHQDKFDVNKPFTISFDIELVKLKAYGYKFKFISNTKQFTVDKNYNLKTLRRANNKTKKKWSSFEIENFVEHFTKNEKKLILKMYQSKITPSTKYEKLEKYLPEIVGLFYYDKEKILQQCNFWECNGAFNQSFKWQLSKYETKDTEYLALVRVPERKTIIKSVSLEVNK